MQNEMREYFVQQDAKFRSIIEKYNLTPEALEALIKAPALNKANVQLFMNGLSQHELAQLFYTTGLYKLAETVDAAQAKHNVESSNSGPPPGSPETLSHEGHATGSD